MPESKDTDWDWSEFYHRNNDELVATWGNLANRVLAFTYKNFDGKVPDPGPLTGDDEALLKQVEDGFQSVAQEMEAVHLRAALGEAMRLATEVNRYLDFTAPWQSIKTDRQAAARSVYTAIRAIDSIKLMLAPFLPHTSEKLHIYLGYTRPLFGTQATARWKMRSANTPSCATTRTAPPATGHPARSRSGACWFNPVRCSKNWIPKSSKKSAPAWATRPFKS